MVVRAQVILPGVSASFQALMMVVLWLDLACNRMVMVISLDENAALVVACLGVEGPLVVHMPFHAALVEA